MLIETEPFFSLFLTVSWLGECLRLQPCVSVFVLLSERQKEGLEVLLFLFFSIFTFIQGTFGHVLH